MPSILVNSTAITTEKLLPMVEATTKAAAAAFPITTKTTTAIMTNLSGGSHGHGNKRTIIIYPTGTYTKKKVCFFYFYETKSDEGQTKRRKKFQTQN